MIRYKKLNDLNSVPYLTDIECWDMLNEERHHTDFLDGLKDDIYQFVKANIDEMISHDRYHDRVLYFKQNNYFNHLIVNIALNRTPDYHQPKKTNALYYNEDKISKGEKLGVVEMDVDMAIGLKNEYNEQRLKEVIGHEINHMYDDWQWQSTGHEPLTNNEKWNLGDGKFISDHMEDISNPLLMCLALSLYTSLWTENNAYVNQAFDEFDKVKLRPHNIHQKLKSTTSYRNYAKQMIDLKWYLEKETDENLLNLYNTLKTNYKSLSIPSPKNNTSYKERLIKWAENIYRNFMKRYCGIASLYLDRRANGMVR